MYAIFVPSGDQRGACSEKSGVFVSSVKPLPFGSKTPMCWLVPVHESKATSPFFPLKFAFAATAPRTSTNTIATERVPASFIEKPPFTSSEPRVVL
jgi:hypothetical protein